MSNRLLEIAESIETTAHAIRKTCPDSYERLTLNARILRKHVASHNVELTRTLMEHFLRSPTGNELFNEFVKNDNIKSKLINQFEESLE